MPLILGQEKSGPSSLNWTVVMDGVSGLFALYRHIIVPVGNLPMGISGSFPRKTSVTVTPPSILL